MKQASRGGHHHQVRYLPAAARLSVYHHVARVAAEVRDVVPNPFEYRHIVQHTHIAGVGEALAPDLGEVEKAEDIQPVIVSDHNHIVIARQILAVVGQEIVSAASRVAAAMHVDHYRPLPPRSVRARGPDVQPEAILPALPSSRAV